jgi:hypothetical protein
MDGRDDRDVIADYENLSAGFGGNTGFTFF